MWYVSTMEHHSALKRKEILTQATTWMNPDNIMLSEIKLDIGQIIFVLDSTHVRFLE